MYRQITTGIHYSHQFNYFTRFLMYRNWKEKQMLDKCGYQKKKQSIISALYFIVEIIFCLYRKQKNAQENKKYGPV